MKFDVYLIIGNDGSLQQFDNTCQGRELLAEAIFRIAGHTTYAASALKRLFIYDACFFEFAGIGYDVDHVEQEYTF